MKTILIAFAIALSVSMLLMACTTPDYISATLWLHGETNASATFIKDHKADLFRAGISKGDSTIVVNKHKACKHYR